MNIHYTTQFKKDSKKLKNQNKDLSKLKALIEKFSTGQLIDGKRPILPVTLNGSRKVLPQKSVVIHPGAIEVIGGVLPGS